MHIFTHLHNSNAIFPLKTLHHGGTRTQVSLSSGGCDDHYASPPGRLTQRHYICLHINVDAAR
jgi:hypothetical protein